MDVQEAIDHLNEDHPAEMVFAYNEHTFFFHSVAERLEFAANLRKSPDMAPPHVCSYAGWEASMYKSFTALRNGVENLLIREDRGFVSVCDASGRIVFEFGMGNNRSVEAVLKRRNQLIEAGGYARCFN